MSLQNGRLTAFKYHSKPSLLLLPSSPQTAGPSLHLSLPCHFPRREKKILLKWCASKDYHLSTHSKCRPEEKNPLVNIMKLPIETGLLQTSDNSSSKLECMTFCIFRMISGNIKLAACEQIHRARGLITVIRSGNIVSKPSKYDFWQFQANSRQSHWDKGSPHIQKW